MFSDTVEADLAHDTAQPEGGLMASVLIVDDDPVAMAILQDQLREMDWLVHSAADWPSMSRTLNEQSIQLVVLDVNMPGLSGDKLAEMISRRPRPRPRVVLYSGMEKTELRRMARRVGATGFLCKGSNDAEVRMTLKAALNAPDLD
jgi:CheY-like chemotaxis protein